MLIYASLMRSQIQSAINTANGGSRCVSVGPNLDCFDDGRPLFTLVSPFAIVAPIMLGVAVLLLSFLSWRLWAEYGWTAFKTLGASLEIQRMYLVYQVRPTSGVSPALTSAGLRLHAQARRLFLVRPMHSLSDGANPAQHRLRGAIRRPRRRKAGRRVWLDNRASPFCHLAS